MPLDTASFEDALKVYYTDSRIRNMVYKNNPLLALLPKMTRFGGKFLPIPIQYGVVKGRSATFATAQANEAPGDYEAFEIRRVKDYAVARIDNETLEASEGDDASFMRAATVEVDGALHALTRSLAHAIYRSGTGSIGRVGAVGAFAGGVTPITLTSAEDIVHVEKGMKLVAGNTTDGDGTALSAAFVVATVNRNLGSFELTGDATASWLAAGGGDFIYVEGDVNTTATSRLKLLGLDAWVPPTDPTSTLFNNVNRAVDVTRLGGIRFSASGLQVEEALIQCGWRVYREGARPTHVVLNPVQMSKLITGLGNRVMFDTLKSPDDPRIGFTGVRLMTPVGEVKVFADPNAPEKKGYMLDMESWKLYSLGPAPKIIQTDGNKFLRVGTADSLEVRVGYYAQMGCNAPGHNAVISFP